MESISKSSSGKLMKNPSGKLVTSTVREINQSIIITTNPDSEYAFLPAYAKDFGDDWYNFEFDPTDYRYQDKYQGNCVLSGSSDLLVEINYGDGTIVRENAISNKIVFKSLKTNYNDMFGNQLTSGKRIENHKYSVPGEYIISIKIITGKVTSFTYNHLENIKFPKISLPYLTSIQCNNSRFAEFPIESLTGLDNLSYIYISNLTRLSGGLPDSLFNCIKLSDITFRGCFDLLDIEKSNIRKINQLINLKNLVLGNCNLSKYIKEFNDLPKLSTLSIGTSLSTPELVNSVYSEVDHINPSITTYIPPISNQWEGDTCTYGTTIDRFFLKLHKDSNIDLSKLNHFCCPCSYWNGNFNPIDFPDEYGELLPNVNHLELTKLFRNKAQSNSVINSIYRHATKNPMSQTKEDGTRNMWYGLKVISPINGKYNFTPPDGEYKEPEGFILGESNGNPKNEMEKVYVLVNNYKYTFPYKWW